jgi:DNA-directed RNA polymerase subunit M/transcription elongation factor TFIIS
MAEIVAVSCPECGKKINVRPDIIGKKIRCKGCDEVYLARSPAGKAAAKTSKPAPKADKAASKAIKPEAAGVVPFKKEEEEEVGSNPYGVTDVDLAPRCPECANEMESAEAIICLTCGYNTRTRLRAETKLVHDTTGMDWFVWLTPGILCALAVIGLTTWDIIYWVKIEDWVEGSDWWWWLGHLFIKMWGTVITLFIMYHLVRFAVKRLILDPVPPEIEKKKTRKV